MAASSVAGEPVAGSCWGATAGATSRTMDAGSTSTGRAVGSLGTGGTIDARGTLGAVDDELGGTLEDELLDDDDELGGTLDDELLDDELLDDDELELGGTLDEELLELLELDGVWVAGFRIEVLDVSVAEAGPLSTAVAPRMRPIPRTAHPALDLWFTTHLRFPLEDLSRKVRV